MGDRVEAIRPWDGNDSIIGVAGTVRGWSWGCVHVEFDERISGGHNCAGRCRSGYGWNCDPSILRLVARSNGATAEDLGKLCCGCGKTLTPDMTLGARLFKIGGYCDDCVADRIGHVHSYHFGKELSYAYAKDKITLGVELEIDDPTDEGDRDEVLADLINYARKNKYSLIMSHERDGSLCGNGFESVTAPLTIDDWRSDAVRGQIATLLDSAECYGFDFSELRSNHAGLHVHIGRKDLCGTDRNKSDAVGLLMGWAVTRLWDKGFKRLSRREDIGYCSLLGSGSGGLYDTGATDDRYYAVNIENSKTIELRIFAGARTVDDVLVAVDMCYMLGKWATKKINAFTKRGSYSAKAGKFDDCLEYADRLSWSALLKYSKFPEVTIPAMREAGIDV